MSLLPTIPMKHNTFWKGVLSAAALAAAYNYVDDNFISPPTKACPLDVQAKYFNALIGVERASGEGLKDISLIMELPKVGNCAVEMLIPQEGEAAGVYSAPVKMSPAP